MRLASVSIAALGLVPLLLAVGECRFLVGATSLRGEVVAVAPDEPGLSRWRYDVRVTVGGRTRIVECVGRSKRAGSRSNRDTYRPEYVPGAMVDILYKEKAYPSARFSAD